MSIQLLYLRQLHHRSADVLQTLFRQLGAGDVLREGGEVDARVLFCVPISRFTWISSGPKRRD